LNLIPPKWRDDTAPRLLFPIGITVADEAARAGEARDGWSVPVGGAAEGVSPFGEVTKSIWW
jgi:hypothetical protein